MGIWVFKAFPCFYSRSDLSSFTLLKASKNLTNFKEQPRTRQKKMLSFSSSLVSSPSKNKAFLCVVRGIIFTKQTRNTGQDMTLNWKTRLRHE